MRKSVFLFLAWALLWVSVRTASAETTAQEKSIKLKDGVALRGTVLSKEEGIYKIKHNILGVIAVKEEDVVAVEDVSAAPAVDGATMKSYEQKIFSSPSVMQSIQSLAEDKDVMAMFSDPEVKAAIMRQDVNALQNNEKFLKFTNKPAVRQIAQDVAGSIQGGGADAGKNKN